MKREELEQRLKENKSERKQLKKQLEELPKLEVGWYNSDDDSLMFITEHLENKAFKGYGFYHGKWEDDFFGYYTWTDSLIPMTPKEVLTALSKEAVKRGFKEGVKVNSFESKSCLEHINSVIDDYDGRTINFRPDNALCFGNKCVFLDGKWATIIKENTVHLDGDYNSAQLKDALILLENE